MAHTTSSSVRRVVVVLLTIGASGCGSDLLLPDPPGGGENVALTKLNGDEQTGTVGEQLPSPLVVQVLTERDQPAPGRMVAFELSEDPAAGEVDPDTATTNSNGEASAHWVLGTTPGSHTVVARVVGGEDEDQVAQFRAAAKPAAPATFSAQSPRAQPGRRRQAVATPPAVRVVDRFGNPVQDVPVAWQVTAGDGSVDNPVAATDAAGQSTVQWTLGNRIGVHKLVATIGDVAGSPVTFTAHVLF
jgi:hypothetical protein